MSVMEDIYDHMIRTEKIEPEEILNSMLKSDENLALKSDIENPSYLNIIRMLHLYLEKKGFPLSAMVLEWFIQGYLEYRISNKRQSRKEIIEGITALYRYEKQIMKERNDLMRRY